MKQKNVVIVLLIVFASIYLSSPPRAEAYLDPGTGSYILQILIAGLLSALFMIKPVLSRIKLFTAKLFGRTKEDNDEGSLGQ